MPFDCSGRLTPVPVGLQSGRSVLVQTAGQDRGTESPLPNPRWMTAVCLKRSRTDAPSPPLRLASKKGKGNQPCIECSRGAKNFVNVSFAETPPHPRQQSSEEGRLPPIWATLLRAGGIGGLSLQ